MAEKTDVPGMPDDAEDPDHQGITGVSDHEQHRSPPGEGLRGEASEHPQTSIFDGKGNESVAVLAEDSEGRLKKGTGPDLESALADANDPKTRLGGDF